jgi:topoisomerase-4 subunit A
MADIEEGSDIVSVMLFEPGTKMLIAGSDGRGFVVTHDEMISSTRKGRAVLNLDAPAKAVVLVPAVGDHVATIGENRKMLIFKLDEVPAMARGKGVRLQRYKDGGIADARVFKLSEGLTWTDSAGRNFTVPKAELKEWIGARSDAGRLPPKGFPKNNKFG